MNRPSGWLGPVDRARAGQARPDLPRPRASAQPDWILALPGRTVTLRSQRPDDAAFLATLFRSTATPLPDVDIRVAEHLLDMQFRSQAHSYRAAYPAAWFAILEAAEEPFGRLVLDLGDTSRIVDYALDPAVRGQGLGTAILTALLPRFSGPVRNQVLRTNAASLAMFRRAGFAVVAECDVFAEMEWQPAPRLP